jgi:ADP-ribosyl-[dinitrogen reductase] hydrolase
VLGAILGATLGFEAIPKRWINGLTAQTQLNEDIERYIALFE